MGTSILLSKGPVSPLPKLHFFLHDQLRIDGYPRRHRAVSTHWIGFPHSSTDQGYLKIVKKLLAHNRLNYVSIWTNCSITYCETDQDEPLAQILTDAAVTGNVINARNVGTVWPRRWRQYDPLKHWGQLIQRHSATTRKYLNLQQQQHRQSLVSRKTGFYYVMSYYVFG
jgi:hypothetical protein